MVIKIKYFILLIVCLFLTVASYAQKNELSPNSPFKSKTYGVDWIITSPDSKYITFQKNYEYDNDTLVLIAPSKSNKILFQTGDVYPINVKFSKKGYLFMSGFSSAKLLKLPDLKPVIWKDFKEAFFMEAFNKIAVVKENALQIYSEEGNLEEEIPDVLEVVEKNSRIFYTQKINDDHILFEWTPGSKDRIFTGASQYQIKHAIGDKIIIQTFQGAAKIPEIFFVDLSSGKKSKLEHAELELLSGLANISAVQDGRYFMTLNVKDPIVEKTSAVDIWYANDNRLEKKFMPNQVLRYLIWDAQNNQVQMLSYLKYNKHTDTGNGRYLLAFDQYRNQDYIKQRIQSEMYRYDIVTGEYDYLGVAGLYKTVDKTGNYLLSHDNFKWVLYNIATKEKKEIDLDRDIVPYFSSDGDKILFPAQGKIAEYSIASSKMKIFPLASQESGAVVTGQSDGVGLESFYYRNYFDAQKPMLIKVRDKQKIEEYYTVYQNSVLKPLTKLSSFNINQPKLMPDGKSFLYLKSHYNIVPSFVLNSSGKERMIFKTNPDDVKASEYRMEKIAYTNSKGIQLTGLLYYPRKFDKSQKYPMVTAIYESLRYHSNRYLRDGFIGTQTEGVNIRYYSDRGYFVFYPDIVYDDRGPGRAALDCVEASIAALDDNPNIDFKKIGLLGHSHGGYQTNFIATQSKLFAAYVGGAGNTDIVRSYNSFNYDYSYPFYWQFEEQQYRIYRSFYEAKDLYIDNSPVYHADKVSSPILLWTGTKDENIEWEQSMEYYLGLRRNNKKVIALFYEGDNHSFSNKANREDLFVRIADWFDYYLKGQKKEWIDLLYKKNSSGIE